MSNKPYNINFRSLLILLDDQVYKSFSEDEGSYSITSFISWEAIRKIFPIDSVFLSTFSVYHQTIINEKGANGNFKMRPLVISCEVNDIGVKIEHNTSALSTYLFHDDKSSVENNYFEEVFLNALSKFNLKSEILYSIISKGQQYKASPEDFKELLGINYSNAMLTSRVLFPMEKSIRQLYSIGKIPFYVTINTEKAVIGRGGKINNIVINIINDIDLLRVKRLRPEHMLFIMQSLTKLLPFDYPFLEEGIKVLSDKDVEDIFLYIKNIEKDPDFGKLDTSILIRYKLQQTYGIKLTV